jgi:hypothetical protein
MRRREFISLIGGAAARPLAARAPQAGKLPTIGFVGSDSPAPYADRLRAFRLGLKSTYGHSFLFRSGPDVVDGVRSPAPKCRRVIVGKTF